MRTVSAKVPDKVYEVLTTIAKKRGITLNALLREIIARYLKEINVYPEVDLEVDQNKGDELEELRRKVELLEEIVRSALGVRYHQIAQQAMKKRSMSTSKSTSG